MYRKVVESGEQWEQRENKIGFGRISVKIGAEWSAVLVGQKAS